MSASPPVESYDYALFGAVETQPLSEVRKIIARRTAASWREVPQCTLYEAFDISGLDAATGRLTARIDGADVRPSLLAFVLSAVIAALKAHPIFNASLSADGAALVLKKYYNIGLAVDTPAGLLVPVLRSVEGLDIRALTTAITNLAEKARSNRLSYSDVEGGTFTISSLGRLGGEGFNPIVNAPEVAILGIARAEDRAVVVNGQIAARRILPLSLTFDHRVIDGAQAGRFLDSLRSSLTASLT